MQIVNTTLPIRNVNLLLLAIGMLAMPMLVSCESIITSLITIAFHLSLKSRAYSEFVIQALICCGFVGVLLILLISKEDRALISLSERGLMLVAIVFLVIIISGRFTSHFLYSSVARDTKQLADADVLESRGFIAKMNVASSAISFITDVIIPFILIFTIVRQNRTAVRTTANNI